MKNIWQIYNKYMTNTWQISMYSQKKWKFQSSEAFTSGPAVRYDSVCYYRDSTTRRNTDIAIEWTKTCQQNRTGTSTYVAIAETQHFVHKTLQVKTGQTHQCMNCKNRPTVAGSLYVGTLHTLGCWHTLDRQLQCVQVLMRSWNRKP